MYLDDLYVGMEIDVPAVVIEKEKMLAFAKDYDPIPLHCDEAYAKTTRFGQLIAPGVMTFMSVWARFTELGIFGEQLIAGLSTKIEWHKPVFAGDTLTGKVRISKIVKRNAHNGIAETTMTICNQYGQPVITNVTESVVSYRE